MDKITKKSFNLKNLSSAGKRTARFLLAGACVNSLRALRALRWLETPLKAGTIQVLSCSAVLNAIAYTFYSQRHTLLFTEKNLKIFLKYINIKILHTVPPITTPTCFVRALAVLCDICGIRTTKKWEHFIHYIRTK